MRQIADWRDIVQVGMESVRGFYKLRVKVAESYNMKDGEIAEDGTHGALQAAGCEYARHTGRRRSGIGKKLVWRRGGI